MWGPHDVFQNDNGSLNLPAGNGVLQQTAPGHSGCDALDDLPPAISDATAQYKYFHRPLIPHRFRPFAKYDRHDGSVQEMIRALPEGVIMARFVTEFVGWRQYSHAGSMAFATPTSATSCCCLRRAASLIFDQG